METVSKKQRRAAYAGNTKNVNTFNIRGYNMEHDMARTDPHLGMVWRLITVIAYFVFTLFQCTTVAQAARHSRSIKKFAQDLLQQLLNAPWEFI